jgi:hypothetical protein
MAVQNPPFTTVNGSNPTKRNTGILLQGGSAPVNKNQQGVAKFGQLTLVSNNDRPDRYQGIQVPSHYNGVGFCLEGTSGAISSITQSGIYTLITKTSHGLSVGAKLQVNGTNLPNYNVIHTVKGILNANAFQTDIVYTANASTPGGYSPINGTFAKVTKNKYVASIICTQLAGVANNALFFTACYGMQSYNSATGKYGTQITNVNPFTGVVTKGGQWGVLTTYWNVTGNASLAVEPHPTRAVPGFLVFLQGALIPVQKNYQPKTT